jgi:hypothetical protein
MSHSRRLQNLLNLTLACFNYLVFSLGWVTHMDTYFSGEDGFYSHNCGERIMRSLWELDTSTVVLNDLQAVWHGPSRRREQEAKCSTAVFPTLSTFTEIGTQVSLVTMSHPSLRTVALPPCLPLDIKDSLKEDRGFCLAGCGMLMRLLLSAGCCVFPPEQLSALRTWYIGFRKAKLKKS